MRTNKNPNNKEWDIKSSIPKQGGCKKILDKSLKLIIAVKP